MRIRTLVLQVVPITLSLEARGLNVARDAKVVAGHKTRIIRSWVPSTRVASGRVARRIAPGSGV